MLNSGNGRFKFSKANRLELVAKQSQNSFDRIY